MTFLELPKKKIKIFFSEKLDKNPERHMTQKPKTKSVSNQTGSPGQWGQIWLKALWDLQLRSWVSYMGSDFCKSSSSGLANVGHGWSCK